MNSVLYELNLLLFLVNEIAEELQTLKNSLINNNLLHSCTIQGVTNDWYQVGDEVVGVEGTLYQIEFFYTHFSS